MKSAKGTWAMRGLSLHDRFMAKVFMIPESTCWHWSACHDRDGYAKIEVIDRPAMAHRVSYELFVGPIPEGLVIDHICRVRGCVNPKHLEPVTSKENTMRSSIAPAAVNAQMVLCKNGHELGYRNCPSKSQRFCPTCRRVDSAIRYQSVRVELNAAKREERRLARKPKAQCRNGHAYTERNLYLYKGIRMCRTCREINLFNYKKSKEL